MWWITNQQGSSPFHFSSPPKRHLLATHRTIGLTSKTMSDSYVIESFLGTTTWTALKNFPHLRVLLHRSKSPSFGYNRGAYAKEEEERLHFANSNCTHSTVSALRLVALGDFSTRTFSQSSVW